MKNIFLFIFFNILFANVFSQEINSRKFNDVINTGWKVVYKDGVSKTYYVENGVSVTCYANLSNLYGKYYIINIEIENLTGSNFTFFPTNIEAILTKYHTDRKTKVVSVENQKKGKILSSDEYLKKVNNRQNWASAFNSWGQRSSAERAGYSASVTSTSVSGNTNSYGSVTNYYTGTTLGVRTSSYANGSATSVTQRYNGEAAYYAQQNADKKIQQFDEQLYQIKTVLSQSYLKANTIENRQRLIGAVNLEYENVDKIEILIPVNGKYFSFIFSNAQTNTGTQNVTSNSNNEISSNSIVNELYTQALSLYNNKQFNASIEKVKEAIAKESNNIKLYELSGMLNRSYLNNKEEAISDFTMMIKIDNNSYNGYLNRAYCYNELKKFKEAILDATEALRINPESNYVYNLRALSKSELKDYYGALSDYEKIIKISNSNFQKTFDLGIVYNNMGYNYLQLDDKKQALEYINKALKLSPNYSFIWGSRGEYYYKIGEWKKCIEDMNIAIEMVEKGNDKGVSSAPGLPYYYRALARMKKGKSKEVCMDLNKAIELGFTEAQESFNQNCK